MTSKNRSIGLTLTTSNSDVYIVPTSFKATIDSILISNITSSAITFNLDWYKLSNTTYYPIATTVRMEPNSVLQITDALYLEAGDKIRGLASAGTSIVVTIRVKEQYAVSNL